jgi:hypothetical protein
MQFDSFQGSAWERNNPRLSLGSPPWERLPLQYESHAPRSHFFNFQRTYQRIGWGCFAAHPSHLSSNPPDCGPVLVAGSATSGHVKMAVATNLNKCSK